MIGLVTFADLSVLMAAASAVSGFVAGVMIGRKL